MKDYFRYQKIMLKIFGVSLMGDENLPYTIYSRTFITGFLFMCPLLYFIELFKHDYDVVANMVGYFFATLMSFAKMIVTFRNRKSVSKMLKKLEDEPFSASWDRGGEEESRLIKECVWITNLQTQVYWIFTIITAAANASYGIFTRLRYKDYHKWELSYGPLTVLNITYSPNFEITWLYQNISIFSLGMHFTTIDLLMAAVLAHISYQFKILQNYIRRIAINCSEEVDKVNTGDKFLQSFNCNTKRTLITWSYLQKSLKRAVDYHTAIFSLSAELESVFSGLLLSIFLGTLGMLSFLIFHLSTLREPVPTARCAGEIVITCIQVATVCYWGEQVIFESQEVGKSAYEANFVGTDVRFQKSLAMVIRRSQNPTKITAGKFSDICLATFVWVLRTSYSAFMVVRTANSNKV